MYFSAGNEIRRVCCVKFTDKDDVEMNFSEAVFVDILCPVLSDFQH